MGGRPLRIYDWTEIAYSLPKGEVRRDPIDYNVEQLSKNYSCNTSVNLKPSVLSQFFVFPSVMNNNLVTSIPISNKKAYEKCMKDIAPYFVDVKGYFGLNEALPFEIQFCEPLNEIKELFKTLFSKKQLHPIVQDLYGIQAERPFGLINKNIQLKVLKEKENNINFQDDFDEVFEFLESTFFTNRISLSLVPTYWYYSKELKHSVTIKYFNTKCKEVYLIVDDPTGRVIGMDIYK
ncbi:hypothetical protein [Paenibacillus macerans]|uniref:hypothetical protein n=1 Tax=Paenibacillus macerans TaxID=44252 RepID=UPI003D316612